MQTTSQKHRWTFENENAFPVRAHFGQAGGGCVHWFEHAIDPTGLNAALCGEVKQRAVTPYLRLGRYTVCGACNQRARARGVNVEQELLFREREFNEYLKARKGAVLMSAHGEMRG